MKFRFLFYLVSTELEEMDENEVFNSRKKIYFLIATL